MQLIEAATPLCSGENCTKLEKAILDYIPPWERTPEGYKRRGHACFNLLSSIPVELRSRNAQSRYMELERKFREPDSSPQELRAYTVGSPIEKADAEKMTDEQWLRAIQEYDSEERKYLWENPEKGGASELAQMLQEFVKQEPERFARLSLRFPLGTHPSYIEHTLNGLKETECSTELKLEVCRKAYNEYRDSCGKRLQTYWDQSKNHSPMMLCRCSTGWQLSIRIRRKSCGVKKPRAELPPMEVIFLHMVSIQHVAALLRPFVILYNEIDHTSIAFVPLLTSWSTTTVWPFGLVQVLFF